MHRDRAFKACPPFYRQSADGAKLSTIHTLLHQPWRGADAYMKHTTPANNLTRSITLIRGRPRKLFKFTHSSHFFFPLFLSFYVLPPPQSAADILLSSKKMISFSQNWCHSCRVRVLWPLLEWQKRWDERGIFLCQRRPAVGFNFSLQYLFFFLFKPCTLCGSSVVHKLFFFLRRTSNKGPAPRFCLVK